MCSCDICGEGDRYHVTFPQSTLLHIAYMDALMVAVNPGQYPLFLLPYLQVLVLSRYLSYFVENKLESLETHLLSKLEIPET